ncbi:hypothetical protein D3C75_1076720 [compost metagenome]
MLFHKTVHRGMEMTIANRCADHHAVVLLPGYLLRTVQIDDIGIDALLFEL